MRLTSIIPVFLALAAIDASADVNDGDFEFNISDLEPFDDSQFHVPTIEELLGEDAGLTDFGREALKGELVDYAKNFLGTRYRRGAKGPKAFDCSGFTSYVFRQFGYSLGAASHIQGEQGVYVDLENAQPGDLIFFSGRRAGKHIGHVGMVVDVDPSGQSVKFIHASTSKGVVIDRYPDGGYYSRRFIGVRRVLGAE